MLTNLVGAFSNHLSIEAMLLKIKNLEVYIWLTKNHNKLKDLLQNTKAEEQPQ